MILYLMKNNFKLISRNKLAVTVLLLGPLVTIAMLSGAFKEFMSSYKVPDEFSVGYRLNGMDADSTDALKDAGREAGIELCEYPEGDPEELINNNGLAAFVEFGDGEYTLYKIDDHKPEGAVTEYFFDRAMNEGVNAALDMVSPAAEFSSALPETELDHMPAVDSTDYYGIIYILYFSCCGMICATGMLGSEKKNGIEKKYRVCSISDLGLLMARLLPTMGVVIVCTFIETFVTAALFGVHWGQPLVSALIVIMMILAFCCVGFLLHSISGNLAITVIGLFSVVWILGYLGGSFETYMYSSTSEAVKQITPFYHANRALVELSCMGHSDYVYSSLLFSSCIAAVSMILTIAVYKFYKKT